MAKRRRGRPAKPMPDAIPDTPENVARALLFSPPKEGGDWEYLEEQEIIGSKEPKSKR